MMNGTHTAEIILSMAQMSVLFVMCLSSFCHVLHSQTLTDDTGIVDYPLNQAYFYKYHPEFTFEVKDNQSFHYHVDAYRSDYSAVYFTGQQTTNPVISLHKWNIATGPLSGCSVFAGYDTNFTAILDGPNRCKVRINDATSQHGAYFLRSTQGESPTSFSAVWHMIQLNSPKCSPSLVDHVLLGGRVVFRCEVEYWGVAAPRIVFSRNGLVTMGYSNYSDTVLTNYPLTRQRRGLVSAELITVGTPQLSWETIAAIIYFTNITWPLDQIYEGVRYYRTNAPSFRFEFTFPHVNVINMQAQPPLSPEIFGADFAANSGIVDFPYNTVIYKDFPGATGFNFTVNCNRDPSKWNDYVLRVDTVPTTSINGNGTTDLIAIESQYNTDGSFKSATCSAKKGGVTVDTNGACTCTFHITDFLLATGKYSLLLYPSLMYKAEWQVISLGRPYCYINVTHPVHTTDLATYVCAVEFMGADIPVMKFQLNDEDIASSSFQQSTTYQHRDENKWQLYGNTTVRMVTQVTASHQKFTCVMYFDSHRGYLSQTVDQFTQMRLNAPVWRYVHQFDPVYAVPQVGEPGNPDLSVAVNLYGPPDLTTAPQKLQDYSGILSFPDNAVVFSDGTLEFKIRINYTSDAFISRTYFMKVYNITTAFPMGVDGSRGFHVATISAIYSAAFLAGYQANCVVTTKGQAYFTTMYSPPDEPCCMCIFQLRNPRIVHGIYVLHDQSTKLPADPSSYSALWQLAVLDRPKCTPEKTQVLTVGAEVRYNCLVHYWGPGSGPKLTFSSNFDSRLGYTVGESIILNDPVNNQMKEGITNVTYVYNVTEYSFKESITCKFTYEIISSALAFDQTTIFARTTMPRFSHQHIFPTIYSKGVSDYRPTGTDLSSKYIGETTAITDYPINQALLASSLPLEFTFNVAEHKPYQYYAELYNLNRSYPSTYSLPVVSLQKWTIDSCDYYRCSNYNESYIVVESIGNSGRNCKAKILNEDLSYGSFVLTAFSFAKSFAYSVMWQVVLLSDLYCTANRVSSGNTGVILMYQCSITYRGAFGPSMTFVINGHNATGLKGETTVLGSNPSNGQQYATVRYALQITPSSTTPTDIVTCIVYFQDVREGNCMFRANVIHYRTNPPSWTYEHRFPILDIGR